MYTLRLHEIDCERESSEIGSDEPYVLVVAIDLDAPVSLQVGAGEISAAIPNLNVVVYGPYKDMDSGERRETAASEPNVWNLVGRAQDIPDPERVIFLTALLEKDDGNPEALLSAVEGTLAGALVGSLSLSRDDLVDALITNLASAVALPTGFPNVDDRIGRPQELKFTAAETHYANFVSGVRKKLRFLSEGGTYGLTFELKNPAAASGLTAGHLLEQKDRSVFLDVDGDADDFRAVLRPVEANETQRWMFREIGGIYRIKNTNSGSYLDAFEASSEFRAVLRQRQDDDTQLWIISPDDKRKARVRQFSSLRYLDAFNDGQRSAMTRSQQENDSQVWSIEPNAHGRYIMTQRSSKRILSRSGSDRVAVQRFEQLERAIAQFEALIARPNASQRDIARARRDIIEAPNSVGASQTWQLEQVGGVFEVQQKSSGRHLDAFEAGNHSVVTRQRQGNASQQWAIKPASKSEVWVRQVANARFLDAFTQGKRSVVTRPFQDNDTQKWKMHPY